jgi:5-methyltetrahydropteroyltriglutamate--homocysteine methyltransferase
MKRSTNRILTTHVGSLPRPADLLEIMDAKGGGGDPQAYERRLRSAVAEIVNKQAELGIDVIDDGEYSKPSFVTYINQRLGGFETDKTGTATNQWSRSREALAFPEYYNSPANAGPPRPPNMVCTGPITYKGQDLVNRDIANFKAALGNVKVEEAFMPAISPSNVEDRHQNAYYKTQEEFLFAIADALAEEYKAIVAAGLLVQIDDPRLVSYYALKPDVTVADCQKWAGPRIAAVNHALRDIPTEKIRFHTCYSINMGPRIHDMQLKDCIDMILGIRAGAYSFEAANPRHEHEWKVWETAKLPKESILIPGVISHSTILVEHPELVAERIGRYAKVVGRENVIAGSDCGFATFAGSKEIHPSIVWAKFKALSDGAAIASKQLWG